MYEDSKSVQKKVNLIVRRLLKRWGVSGWKVSTSVCSLGGSTAADIRIDRDYRIADIRIDVQKCGKTEDVVQYLQHEVLHIVVSPMSLFLDYTDRNSDERSLWTSLEEQTIAMLEESLIAKQTIKELAEGAR